MNKLACIVLDYKRPQNMASVLSGIYLQDIHVDVYVIHQGNDRKYVCYENINLALNRGPGARFCFLPMIPNEYTVMLDDDLKLTDTTILRTMLDYATKLDTHVGAYGVRLGDVAFPYTRGERIFHTAEPVPVDVLLGNFNMVNTREASRLWNSNLELIYRIQDPDREREEFIEFDDLIISWLYHKTGKMNFVVGTGVKPYQELDLSEGLENRDDHMSLRDIATRRLFSQEQERVPGHFIGDELDG